MGFVFSLPRPLFCSEKKKAKTRFPSKLIRAEPALQKFCNYGAEKEHELGSIPVKISALRLF
jgi:hypothetical protein